MSRAPRQTSELVAETRWSAELVVALAKTALRTPGPIGRHSAGELLLRLRELRCNAERLATERPFSTSLSLEIDALIRDEEELAELLSNTAQGPAA